MYPPLDLLSYDRAVTAGVSEVFSVKGQIVNTLGLGATQSLP